MRCISIWQPWASLIITRHKLIETRGWPAPKSLIGRRIGIASTKSLRPEQVAAYEDDLFQELYQLTDLPPPGDLPRGCILGTVLLHSCEIMTPELMEDVTDEEKIMGDWQPGRYAWRLFHPIQFEHPIPVRGAQGVWIYDPHDVFSFQTEAYAY